MNKFTSSWKSAAIVMVILSIGNLWAQGSQPIRWNVLFFMCDMQNVHYMSVDNQSPQNVYTPNLERLAKEGMIFDKAYASVPVCAPTRTSIITGEYPQKHGHYGNSAFMVEGGPTGKTPSLGHIFRNAGYNTALLGKTHSNMAEWDSSPDKLFQGKNLFWGFDYRLEWAGDSRYPGSQSLFPSPEIVTAKQNMYAQKYSEALTGAPTPSWEAAVWVNAPNPPFSSGSAGSSPAKTMDGATTFDALEYLDQYAKGTVNSDFKINNPTAPFFLYVSLLQPHEAWRSPNMQDSIDFYAMYSGRPEDDSLTYRHKKTMRKKMVPLDLTPDDLAFPMLDRWPKYGEPYPELSPSIWRLQRARYSSSVSWIDHLLGKVMDKLETLDDPNNPGKKLSETTILTYASDHGSMNGEKYRMGKVIMQEASARVPFLMRMPGVVPAGQRSNILINHVDMLPTVIGLCGLGSQLRKEMWGKDLSAAVKLNNASLGQERTFSEWIYDSNFTRQQSYVMARSQQFKFIRFPQKRPDGKPYMVLFDMDNDPHETKNLADDPKYAAIVNRESAAIDTFLMRTGVPPLNLQLPVSTRIAGITPVGSKDLTVVNGKISISFLPGKNLQNRNSVVEICIYSPNGAVLKRIAFNAKNADGYSWDLRGDDGQRVKSNLYLYRCGYHNEQGRQVSVYGKLIRAGR